MPKGLATAPKSSTLKMGGPTQPRSCRRIPVPSVRPSDSLHCPVVLRLCMPRFLLHHNMFGQGVIDGRGPAQPHQRGNFLCRRDWTQLREAARSEWANLPAPEVAAYPWCAVCQTHVGWRPDSVSDSESECRDLDGLEPLPLLQHSKTSQSTGCFRSLCPVQYRTLGVSPQRFGSAWEMDADTRRRRVRALLTQAALLAKTTTEKDGILEAMQEQQDWEDSLPPRWPGDADFQLSPTQPVARRSKAAPVTQRERCRRASKQTATTFHFTSSHQIAPCAHHFIICTSLQRDFPQTRACLPHCAPCRRGHHRCTSGYTPPTGQAH